MKTEKGKCNHDKFVQGQLGEECLKCGLLRTTIDNIEGYHQSESIEWEKKFDKKFGLLDGESWEPLHTELKSFISQAIASAVEAREMEISEAVKKMKTYTGGSSVNEKDKRVNKAEVLSIINPSK